MHDMKNAKLTGFHGNASHRRRSGELSGILTGSGNSPDRSPEGDGYVHDVLEGWGGPTDSILLIVEFF